MFNFTSGQRQRSQRDRNTDPYYDDEPRGRSRYSKHNINHKSRYSYDDLNERANDSLDRNHRFSRRRSRYNTSRESSRSSRSHSRSRSLDTSLRSNKLIRHATNAAIDAAALEVFRLRREPGEWAGRKGVRVATAALGAAMVDAALLDRHPGKQRKQYSVKSTIGGLLANRLLNGPRHERRGR